MAVCVSFRSMFQSSTIITITYDYTWNGVRAVNEYVTPCFAAGIEETEATGLSTVFRIPA
jgi:hypothetical protein